MCIVCDLKRRAYLIWQRQGSPDGRALDNWLEAEREEIRLRAYFIWEREGRLDGRALDNWVQAEQEVAEELRRLAENQRRLALLKLRWEAHLIYGLGLVAIIIVVLALGLAIACRRLGIDDPFASPSKSDRDTDPDRGAQ